MHFGLFLLLYTFFQLKSVRSLDAFEPQGKTLLSIGSNFPMPLTSTFSLPITTHSSQNTQHAVNPLNLDPFGFSTKFSTMSGNVTTTYKKMNPFIHDLIQTSLHSRPSDSVTLDPTPTNLFCQGSASHHLLPPARAEKVICLCTD